MSVSLSIVIPVLNDAVALQTLLDALPGGQAVERIVVDGGSDDASRTVARAAGCRLLVSDPGRGQQLAAGVEVARAPWIWMLHADAVPSSAAVSHLLDRSADTPGWGRFAVSLAPGSPLQIVAKAMNLRSRLTGICTGDQGIFAHRTTLQAAGGVPAQPLMEDIELCRRLRRVARPDCRDERIASSPRRWRHNGVVRTVLSMWAFRLRYWCGADPVQLAAEYYRR